MPVRFVDATPILEAAPEPPPKEPRRFHRAWYRMRSTGQVTIGAADTFCVEVLGVHPVDVFGPTWWRL